MFPASSQELKHMTNMWNANLLIGCRGSKVIWIDVKASGPTLWFRFSNKRKKKMIPVFDSFHLTAFVKATEQNPLWQEKKNKKEKTHAVFSSNKILLIERVVVMVTIKIMQRTLGEKCHSSLKISSLEFFWFFDFVCKLSPSSPAENFHVNN